MKIAIASDHAGYKLKQFLIEKFKDRYKIIDLGADSDQTSFDYNDYAEKVVQKVFEEKIFGVLLCKSGIGMSIAANRHKFIRAALCKDAEAAKLSREHNDANILVMAGELDYAAAAEALEVFLNTKFSEGERHIRRVKKLSC